MDETDRTSRFSMVGPLFLDAHREGISQFFAAESTPPGLISTSDLQVVAVTMSNSNIHFHVICIDVTLKDRQCCGSYGSSVVRSLMNQQSRLSCFGICILTSLHWTCFISISLCILWCLLVISPLPIFHFRELLEESCVHAEDLLPAGRIEFEFQGDPCLLDVHVFTVEKFEGIPQETEGK